MPSPNVQSDETGRTGAQEGGIVGSYSAVQARCPLCGSPVLSVSRGGRVVAEGLRPILLGPDSGRGYSLCDDCGVLAFLPRTATLN